MTSGDDELVVRAVICRDAKLVVLDWDELAGSITTSSLHSFDKDAQLRNGRSVFPQGPRVLTDPQVTS